MKLYHGIISVYHQVTPSEFLTKKGNVTVKHSEGVRTAPANAKTTTKLTQSEKVSFLVPALTNDFLFLSFVIMHHVLAPTMATQRLIASFKNYARHVTTIHAILQTTHCTNRPTNTYLCATTT